MPAYIHDMIASGEGQKLDFKFCITDSKKIARSLVAFANTDGGTLLIGVKDNGIVAGVRSDEELYMLEAAAKMYSKPGIELALKNHVINGKTLIEAKVKKSPMRPHSAPDNDGIWKVYIRVHDQNLLANRVLLKVWENETRQQGILIRFTEKEKMLLRYLEENKTISMAKYCKIAHLPWRIAENTLIRFISVGMLEMRMSDKGTVYAMGELENKLMPGFESDSLECPIHRTVVKPFSP